MSPADSAAGTAEPVTTSAADAAWVVREMARRFGAGDFAGAQALMAPAIRIEQPASLPHGGWHDGRDGMAAMGVAFARHWDRTITNPRVYGHATLATQITTQTWTAKATGRSATIDVVELFTVVGGEIVEIRVFQQDTHLLLATLPDQRP
ncbi:SnoaL-like domain-containing protein [Frankia sp. AiPs1]|uniref:nuclear transport factor 2 family protein n=1 Tax=Frankia sp. AiPa1 TaxID=573492 RepID=UPI00202AD621|nr:nuclear transport factor 2 family protein [Frankia sp. AiPa1]MCL9761583.1 nuclear transport factor 2 family protein [Frankia sp. AiPa1]